MATEPRGMEGPFPATWKNPSKLHLEGYGCQHDCGDRRLRARGQCTLLRYETTRQMSRTIRFLGGVWLGYLYQGLVMLVGFWLTPFLLRHIGQHDYGLWLLGLQLLSYLMLTDFGVIALLPRETAYAIGRAGSLEKATELTLLIGQAGRVVLYQTP